MDKKMSNECKAVVLREGEREGGREGGGRGEGGGGRT